ncbi:hypothetical protein ABTY59_31885 [Streptomyces sp. NPDC096079]|uniref:hypothetical protein n=1 Tax=Streptomyces sp. NPDC096079 TaxID=3155820 RepID=UPI003333BF07
MSVPFTEMSDPLVERVRAAREHGDDTAARQALKELLALYARLGERLVGTVEEQNEYIVPRHLGFLPAVLQSLGVRSGDFPEPPGRRRPPSPPPALDVERIADRFALIGNGRGSEDQGEDAPGRFDVAYRPQDNVVVGGVPQNFAVIDTEGSNLPVAWYECRDWAEAIAAMANSIRRAA